ncbi:MAG: hypothetical protein ACI85Q_001910 [Salibacteraceae bacterium]
MLTTSITGIEANNLKVSVFRINVSRFGMF